MSKYRIVHKDFFLDNFIYKNDRDAKLLFLYLIVNNNNEIAGFYQLNIPVISVETQIPVERITQLFQEFEAEGKVFYEDGFVFIKNMAKRQNCLKMRYVKKHVFNMLTKHVNHKKNKAYQEYLKEMIKINLIKEEEAVEFMCVEDKNYPLPGVKKQETINTQQETNIYKQETNNFKQETENKELDFGENSAPDAVHSHKEANNVDNSVDKLLTRAKLHEIQQFVVDNCPNVAKLNQQLTFEQCLNLEKEVGFNLEHTKKVLEQMDNYSILCEKYISVYKTLKNWIKIDESNRNSSKQFNKAGLPEWQQRELGKKFTSF